jgi:asparagine synthase (glutamine-hydrolysing)
MCGIAGYKLKRPVDETILREMVQSLYHRGPDFEGYYRSPPYSAGMRRLSINDLITGDQPLYNESEQVVLMYNGEIYNSPELRLALEEKGHVFRTRSDGEVICHLYEEHKEDLFEWLDGMFAVALWDNQDRKLILARDIPGEKPLYYSLLSNEEIVFASEIKSLAKFPGLDLSLNEQALWDFPTFLWVPEPITIYESISALPRRHLLVMDGRGVQIRPYRNKFNGQKIDQDDEAVIQETRRVVTEAIRSRLLSDVPVGSFLSGGLDSSIVATVASEHLPELTTFCIAFEDVSDPYHGRADESAFAEHLAKRIGSKHSVIHVTSEDFRRDLPVFCRYGDQPFAVSSGLGILAIARAANQAGIKVLLSGDGADESFGGYSWYFHLDRRDLVTGSSIPIEEGSSVSFQNMGLDVEDRLKILYRYSPHQRAWAWHYYGSESEKAALFNREYFSHIHSSLQYFRDFKGNEEWTPEDFVRQDREFYFPYEMLRKVDRMGMAYSVEGRVPFAAPAVLAHADKLAFHHLIRDSEMKWVLKRAFADTLPEIILRRPKHGFNVPIDHWLRGEWSDLVREAFCADSALMKTGLLHDKSYDIAKRMLFDRERLNGHTIFCFIMLNLWLEQVHHGNCC